jgi:hypothetical protein
MCLSKLSDKCKCSSSVIRIMTSSATIQIKSSATVPRFAISRSLNSCTTTILYGWKFGSLCKILLTLRSDIPRATEYLLAQRLGLLMNYCIRASVFCGNRIVRTSTGAFILNTEALVLKFPVHSCMVLRKGTFL